MGLYERREHKRRVGEKKFEILERKEKRTLKV